jgi:hypothetical protein
MGSQLKFAGYVACSAIIHTIFVISFPKMPELSSEKPNAVKITLSKSSLVADQMNGANTKLKELSGGAEAQSTIESPRTTATSYGDLFPTREVFSNNWQKKPDSKVKYRGEHLTKVLASAIGLSSGIDVPLALRTNIAGGEAWANLTLNGQAINVDYIGGDPHLRSAVFEALRQRHGKARLLEMFHYLGKRQIKIRVIFHTLHIDPSSVAFARVQKIYEDEIEISLLRYKSAPQFGVAGMAIEDKHSRLAKKRDRAHLTRLRSSPAFQHPIRNFRLH